MKSLLLSAMMTFALAMSGCALQSGGGSLCGEQPVSNCTVLSGDCGCGAPRGLTPPRLLRQRNNCGCDSGCGQDRGMLARFTNRSAIAGGCSSCGDATCNASCGGGCGSAPCGDAGCGCGAPVANTGDCGCAPAAGGCGCETATAKPVRRVVRRLGDSMGQRAIVSRVTSRLGRPDANCSSCEAPAADCGCAASAETDCGCGATTEADCGCNGPARQGILSRIADRRIARGGSGDCGCEPTPCETTGCETADCGCEGEVVTDEGCGCDAVEEESVGGLLGSLGVTGRGLFRNRSRAGADAAQPIGSGILSGARPCGVQGCGDDGRFCNGCLSKLRGARKHPYGGAIPHTAQAPGNGTGMAPSYAYPYYTTRGPRDFLMAKPPSIGY